MLAHYFPHNSILKYAYLAYNQSKLTSCRVHDVHLTYAWQKGHQKVVIWFQHSQHLQHQQYPCHHISAPN